MSIALLARGKPPVMPTLGLTVYYDFVQGANAQTLYDKSGNARDAVLGSTSSVEASDPTWTTAGLVFNGTGSKVTTPSLPASSGADTFSFLVPPAPASGVGTVYSQLSQSSTAGFIWIYRNASGTVASQYTNGTATQTATANLTTWATGDFGTVVMDYTNNLISFYRNGGFVQSVTMTTPVAPPAGIGGIGFYYWNGNNFASGTQSYFARYARALSAREVQQAYKAAKRSLSPRGVVI